MKVLLIEDNPVDLKLVRAVVQESGHDALERRSAEGALEVIRSYGPDVILLDLHLPGANDGLALVRELQRYGDTCRIPIVAVTAYPHRYTVSDVLGAGCSICIVKPINTRELVSRLHAVAAGAVPSRIP